MKKKPTFVGDRWEFTPEALTKLLVQAHSKMLIAHREHVIPSKIPPEPHQLVVSSKLRQDCDTTEGGGGRGGGVMGVFDGTQ